MPERVTITIVGPVISADPDEVHVSKKGHGKAKNVHWKCETKDVTIEFTGKNGSPFPKTSYGPGKNITSHDADKGHGSTQYKYTIRATGCQPLDPNVIIDP